MRSSRMRDESIKDLHMGKSEVGTRGVIGVPSQPDYYPRVSGCVIIQKNEERGGRGRQIEHRVMTSWMLTKKNPIEIDKREQNSST